MNEGNDPARADCFRITTFETWKPGERVCCHMDAPTKGAWLLAALMVMVAFGIIFALLGGGILLLGLNMFIGGETISFWEAGLLCFIPGATLGLIHLTGGFIPRSLEIDWSEGSLKSTEESRTQSFALDDLEALVLRGEWDERSESTGSTSGEHMRSRRVKYYSARLDARFSHDDVVPLLHTDSTYRDAELAIEDIAPYAQELADSLNVEVFRERSVRLKSSVRRSFGRAPFWQRALFFLAIGLVIGWIGWRVQPALSWNRAFREIEDLGGKFYERDSWTIGGAQFGPVNGISFEDVAITDEDLLSHQESLQKLGRFELNLSGTRISDEGLQVLSGNGNLIAINLYGTSISDRGVEALKDCRELIEIDLTRTRVTDPAIPVLARLPNLKSLRLYHTRISDSALPDLKQMNNLKELYLRDSAMTPAALKQLKAALPETEIVP